MAASSDSRRCHYEVLGVDRNSTPEEIRSAYKKLALQLHPDKLIQSGLSHSEATAKFQELSHSYEVLSDPKERSWYDSHRSQILFSDVSESKNSLVPDLFAFFSTSVFSGYTSESKRSFYRVYSDVFDRIYSNEVEFARRLGLGLGFVKEAPAMGDLESPYTQATAFYGYWLGFSTVMDFCWADVYDAAGGINRKSRRVMEEENKKVRRKARREYNETVRGLAEFVKKRDKRVIDMAVKRNLEIEKRKEEERERRKRAERERLERAMAYEEPDWARGVEEIEESEESESESESGVVEEKREELYCVVCGKKFKNAKQWENHERSKKHREKVAELREEMEEEEEELGERFEDGVRIGGEESGVSDDGDNGFGKVGEKDGNDGENGDGFRGVDGGDNGFEKVGEKHVNDGENGDGFRGVDGGDNGFGEDEEKGEVDGENGLEKVGQKHDNDEEEEEDENVEDDIIALEAMLGGRKNRKKAASSRAMMHVEGENEGDEMEYNNRKNTRKSRRAKKEKSFGGGEQKGERRNDVSEENNGDDGLIMETNSHSLAEENRHSSNQRGDRKGIVKSEANSKSKNSSKGKKAKEKSKNTSNACEKCGEEFESKNKLHKHLSDTGHSTLKYR